MSTRTATSKTVPPKYLSSEEMKTTHLVKQGRPCAEILRYVLDDRIGVGCIRPVHQEHPTRTPNEVSRQATRKDSWLTDRSIKV